MRSFILFIILFNPLFINAQGGLYISSGTEFVINNNPHIVINNGEFKNDGAFSAGNSTVQLTGNAATPNSTIGGTSNTIFNHLNINKTANDTRLDYDIEVDGDIQMNGGNLILNYSDIILSGSIMGETNVKRITGTDGGAIIKTVNLNNPIQENPGNLGIEITSTENLGNTYIARRHTMMTSNGNESIYRRYDISPDNNSNLDATLRIHYFDEELNGLTEADLKIWHFDGANWTTTNMYSKNESDNWVEASDIQAFHTLTLAVDMSQPLPIELLSFTVRNNGNDEIELFWSTANEINNELFEIERSTDGVHFEKINQMPGAGTTSNIQHYQLIDKNPFSGINYYRIKQIDFDGTFSHSPIRSATIHTDIAISLFPNPTINAITLKGSFQNEAENINIKIYDTAGRLVIYKNYQLEDAAFSFEINEVANLAEGNYLLLTEAGSEIKTFPFSKIRQ